MEICRYLRIPLSLFHQHCHIPFVSDELGRIYLRFLADTGPDYFASIDVDVEGQYSQLSVWRRSPLLLHPIHCNPLRDRR